MKRILAISILSYMMVSSITPIIDNSHQEARIDKKQEMSLSENNVSENEVKLQAGASEILFSEIEIKEWKRGWCNESAFIRSMPLINSDTIIAECEFNKEFYYYKYDNEWSVISVIVESGKTIEGYISNTYISKKEYHHIEHTLPQNVGFKSYMPFEAITDKDSKQYALQQLAKTDRWGIRVVDRNRYCVAIGTAFNASIGTYFDLILESGEVIPCIVGDIKADKDTKSDNITTASNGCVSEFIVDEVKLNKEVKRDGDISSCFENWNSPVSKIKIYNKNVFEEGEECNE